MKVKIFPIMALAAALALGGCKGLLDEEVYSQLAPSTLLTSKTGIERVLFGAYDYAAIHGNFGGNMQFQEEWTCDQFWETGGAVNQQYVPMSNFAFTSEYPTHWTQLWNRFYKGIRNCNIVLENLDGAPVDEATKKLLAAEARFIRASIYYKASSLWGAIPLKKTQADPSDMERTPADKIGKFVEDELLAILDDLPEKGAAGYEYGRATKGAAQCYLVAYYLNSKQWDKCADMAQEIITGGKYSLWDDYTTLFTVDNERVNNEYIWAYTCSAQGTGNEMMNGAFPQDFKFTADHSIEFLPNMRNWARMDRVLNSFYDTFDPADKRRQLIITEYYNSKGNLVSLDDNSDNGWRVGNYRAFKFTPDKGAVENAHGNDIPVFRYSYVLLSRAEALNEMNGPSQEVMDLIRQVRDRAGLSTKAASEYTKETLRAAILDERSWEFYGENQRRQDLIRHGLFISKAKERLGDWVDDHFLVFPIPQTEVNANRLCGQNEGY